METTSNTLKALLFGVLFLAGSQMMAQVTTNPDTVCAGATGEAYLVANTAGSTYNWVITGGGGAQVTGSNTSSITVDWGNTPGLYPSAVSITETDVNGCPGAPMVLDVRIIQVALSALGPFCAGDSPQILSPTPTGGTLSGTGVVGGNFDPVAAGTGTHIITYDLAGCITTINVVVNTGPTTGPIQHF
ncbi:MAG: hypothetical protein H8E84_04110 [Flavobacteriales bacterium]|nr:hypothetical protein [Flavobacteriales bacterium]